MSDPTGGFGLTWEQIAIGAVCFVILVVVLVAAIRGLGPGRRKAPRIRETTREPLYRPGMTAAKSADRRVDEPPLTGPAATDQGRMEPSLVPSENPPTPEETAPPLETVELTRYLQDLSDAQADTARNLKILKAQFDEFRHTDTRNAQRLDAAEELLKRLRAEARAASGLVQELAVQVGRPDPASTARATKQSPRPPRPPVATPTADASDTDEDPSVARARQAIEELERQERGRG